jgi:hypothetical protein
MDLLVDTPSAPPMDISIEQIVCLLSFAVIGFVLATALQRRQQRTLPR